MTWNNDLAPVRPSLGRRFFGGPPLAVLSRLVFVSLVVGAVLMWLDVDPMDVVQGVVRAGQRVWAMGFDAFGKRAAMSWRERSSSCRSGSSCGCSRYGA